LSRGFSARGLVERKNLAHYLCGAKRGTRFNGSTIPFQAFARPRIVRQASTSCSLLVPGRLPSATIHHTIHQMSVEISCTRPLPTELKISRRVAKDLSWLAAPEFTSKRVFEKYRATLRGISMFRETGECSTINTIRTHGKDSCWIVTLASISGLPVIQAQSGKCFSPIFQANLSWSHWDGRRAGLAPSPL